MKVRNPVSIKRLCDRFILVLLMPFVIASTCMTSMNPPPSGDDTPADMMDDGVVSFATDVLPLFTANCASCHAPGEFADDQGITMYLTEADAYSLIVNKPSDQDAGLTRVIPGDSANSLLYQKISQDNPPVGIRMPFLRLPLSQSDIDTIKNWIDQGALNN